MAAGVAISRALLDRLLAEAAASGDELCGLLLGRDGEIEAAWPVANAAAEPARAFLLDPAAHLAASRRAREEGRRIVGHYHSHPGGRPEPSAADRAMAQDEGVLWLILGGGAARLWVDRGGGLTELPLRPS